MELTDLKIGDRIYGKQTGTLTPATVVGWLPPGWHPLGSTYSRWDDLYPDWKEKYMIFAEYDEPTPNVTFEEFRDQTMEEIMSSTDTFVVALRENRQLLNLFLENQYQKTVRLTTKICYPIDDVQLI